MEARPLVLVKPLGWEERLLGSLGVDPGRVVAYALYWDPMGDELVCVALADNGLVVEGDADFTLLWELESLNPHLKSLDIGSSEAHPREVILVDRVKSRAYAVPYHAFRGALGSRELLEDLYAKAPKCPYCGCTPSFYCYLLEAWICTDCCRKCNRCED